VVWLNRPDFEEVALAIFKFVSSSSIFYSNLSSRSGVTKSKLLYKSLTETVYKFSAGNSDDY
jgi:hypothetical protein